MQKTIENLYDFKKIMMSTMPEILRCTINDTHGKIESIIAEHIADLTDEQWRAVFDWKYSELFQDGIPHVSWNTDRSKILNAILNAESKDIKGFEELNADTWAETWVNVRVKWIRVPSGTVIKYKREDPRVWSSGSNTRYCGSIVEEKDVPRKATHCVVLLAVNGFNEAMIVDQYAGPQDECEDWLVKSVAKYGKDIIVKFIELKKK